MKKIGWPRLYVCLLKKFKAWILKKFRLLFWPSFSTEAIKIRFSSIFCFASFDSFKALTGCLKTFKIYWNDLVFKKFYTSPVLRLQDNFLAFFFTKNYRFFWMQFKIRFPLIFVLLRLIVSKLYQLLTKNLKFKRNDLVYKKTYTSPVLRLECLFRHYIFYKQTSSLFSIEQWLDLISFLFWAKKKLFYLKRSNFALIFYWFD